MGTYAFIPPLAPLNPPFLPDSPRATVMLWRHYRPRMVGVNVFLLNNGSYVQQIATPTLVTPIPSHTRFTDTTNPVLAMTAVAGHVEISPQPPWEATTALKTSNVPYPWNPTNPTDPYVHIQNWTGSVTTITLTPRIKKVYYGGHKNRVTETEAASLIAAGYGTCIEPWTTT